MFWDAHLTGMFFFWKSVGLLPGVELEEFQNTMNLRVARTAELFPLTGVARAVQQKIGE